MTLKSPLYGLLNPFSIGLSGGRGSVASPLAIYAILGFTPPLVADFENEVYATDSAVTTFSGMFTHSGASLRTMVDSDGVLKWAPHNLNLRSEEFDSVAWTKTASTISANAGTDPDGGSTADKFVETATTAQHFMLNHIGTTVIGSTVTFAIFAKAAERSQIALGVNSAAVLTYSDVIFNLADGTIANAGAGNLARSITSVGDGWYLCSVTVSITGATSSPGPFWKIANGGATNYAGDGSSGIFVWGAHAYRSDLGGMVNNPDRSDSYVPTTTVVRYLPRRGHHVWDGSAWASEGLLLESEARINLLLNSGTLSTQSVTVTAAAHTLSFTGTGTVTLSGVSTAGPLVGTGTGENNRVSLTFTPTAGSLTLTVTGTVTNAQLELGSTASSYILTYGAAVARVAETLTIAGANMPYSATAMSFQMDGRATFADRDSATDYTFFRWQADANNLIRLSIDTAGANTGQIDATQIASGTSDTVGSPVEYTPGSLVEFNVASRHGATFVNVAKDGTAGTADTTPTALPALASTTFDLGHAFMGTIRKFRAWGVDIGDAGIGSATSFF